MEATILAATLMTIPQTFPQGNTNQTNDSTQKTMNEIPQTDWIDDILDSDDDDGLDYEDMYYETIDNTHPSDVQ